MEWVVEQVKGVILTHSYSLSFPPEGLPSCLKVVGWVVGVVAQKILVKAHGPNYPFPFGFDWDWDWNLAWGLSILIKQIYATLT